MPHPFERRFKRKMRQTDVAHFGAHDAHFTSARLDETSNSHGRIAAAANPITRIAAADRQKTVAMMTRAFIADPPSRFLYPDLELYLRAFPRFIEAFAGAAFDRHEAYGIANFAGAALWLPPGAHPDAAAMAILFEETIPAGRRAEVFEVIAQMGNYHPAEPHWHLAMIGVEPDDAGKGYGSALLEAGLARVDRKGETAHLESTNPQNIPLYEKFGFKLVGTIATGRCPPVFPMVRRVS